MHSAPRKHLARQLGHVHQMTQKYEGLAFVWIRQPKTNQTKQGFYPNRV